MLKVKIRFTGNQEIIEDYIKSFNFVPDPSLAPMFRFENVSKPYPNRGSNDVRIYADLVWLDYLDKKIESGSTKDV